MKQSTRSRRPPELTIKTNVAMLRSSSRSLEGESAKSKETELFKKMQEETPSQKAPTPTISIEKVSTESNVAEKDNW